MATLDSGDQSKPIDSEKQIRDDRALIGPLLVLVAIVGDAFLPAIGAFDSDRLILAVLCGGWITAGIGLLLIWFGLGSGKQVFGLVYLATTLALGTLVVLGRGGAVLTTGLAMILFSLGVICSPPILLGYEIRSILPSDLKAFASKKPANQFSLRRMMLGSVVASLVAAAVGLAKPTVYDLCLPALLTTAFTLIAVMNAFVVLRPKSIRTVGFLMIPFFGFVALFTPLIVLIFEWIDNRANQGSNWFFTYDSRVNFLLFSHVLLTSSALIIYRKLQFRIVRRRHGNVPVEIWTNVENLQAMLSKTDLASNRK